MDEDIRTNLVSTVGTNINEVEKQMTGYIGIDHAVALSCGTAALHFAIKLAQEKLYGQPLVDHGTLEEKTCLHPIPPSMHQIIQSAMRVAFLCL